MRCSGVMAVYKEKRQSICVWEENWTSYCKMKEHHMREYGHPELSFTEFVNACTVACSGQLTLSNLLEIRKKHYARKIRERLEHEFGEKFPREKKDVE